MIRGAPSSRESGFAVLFVFAMAAAAAFLFYRELPRVALERQREKEQLLIERGEQYRRAIQLYVRKFNRYPAQLSDLEKTNNIRFLRRRYKDPMTGKAEWRLIHMGPGGVLTDSVLSKPGGTGEQKTEDKEPAQGEGAQGPLPVVRRRPSEMPGMQPVPGSPTDTPADTAGGVDQPGGEAFTGPPPYPGQPNPDQPRFGSVPPGEPEPSPGGVVVYPVPPGQQPPYAIPGQTPGPFPVPAQGQPGDPTWQPGMIRVAPVPGAPGYTGPPGTSGQVPGTPGSAQPQPPVQQPQSPYPTQNVPGLPAPYGQPGVPSIGAITISPGSPQQPTAPPGMQLPYSTQPGVGGAPVPGYTPFPQPGSRPVQTEAGQNPALQLIRDLLTRPRPGGLAGIQQQQQAPTLAGQIMGGGVAGVASTLEAEAIMVYNERTKYNEWEFVYDFRKDPLRLGRLGAGAGQPGGTSATPATDSPGQSPATPRPGTRRR